MSFDRDLKPESDEVGRLEKKGEFYAFKKFIRRASYKYGQVMDLMHRDSQVVAVDSTTSTWDASASARTTRSMSKKAEELKEVKVPERYESNSAMKTLYLQEMMKEEMRAERELARNSQDFAIFLDSRIGTDVRRLLHKLLNSLIN
jgi:hypothetical protein